MHLREKKASPFQTHKGLDKATFFHPYFFLYCGAYFGHQSISRNAPNMPPNSAIGMPCDFGLTAVALI
jgi:hypothetical protein